MEIYKFIILRGAPFLFASFPLLSIGSSAEQEIDFSAEYSLKQLTDAYKDAYSVKSNRSLIVKYLSGSSLPSMRMTVSCQTMESQAESRRQLAKYGRLVLDYPVHSQINFGPTNFLLQEIAYPPEEYTLAQWEQTSPQTVIRSDLFADGKFTSLRNKGQMLYEEFPSFEGFKMTCIKELARPPKEVFAEKNLVRQREAVSFRKYSTYQNLGHEGVIPLSFRFKDESSFVCDLFQGGGNAGRLVFDTNGVVRQIQFDSKGYIAKRSFLLLYDRENSYCWWFPSRILEAIEGERCKIRAVHTIHDVRQYDDGLDIPNNTAALYSTNVKTELTWSNNVPYTRENGILVENRKLAESAKFGGDKKGRYILILLVCPNLVLIAFWCKALLRHNINK